MSSVPTRTLVWGKGEEGERKRVLLATAAILCNKGVESLDCISSTNSVVEVCGMGGVTEEEGNTYCSKIGAVGEMGILEVLALSFSDFLPENFGNLQGVK